MMDVLPDIPPERQEMVACSLGAALAYDIPANILLAVAEKEGGKPGQWVRNENGTFDVGALQFNTAYLRELSRFGITPKDVAAPGCYPFLLAAWRIRGHLRNDEGDVWTRAANYHSRTPRFNARYRADLIRRATRWTTWLDGHFPTHDAVVDVAPYGKR
ncbi:conjugal transfer protein TrbN [Luteibacter flocculans]|uniref:Conjugal transfer protein TrbN n=1 Tax=Luteibacter flocculans TaxID=2780091 RepID=A0ABY4T0H1_9GAMM|nr:conjugal transfer protein TrbN [Luteibacter flocculans]